MFVYLYLLECDDNTIYTGVTKDLEKRFRSHKRGFGANYTRRHGAKRLLYAEAFSSRSGAMRKEREVKKWTHRSKRELAEGRLIQPVYFDRYSRRLGIPWRQIVKP